MLKAPISRTIGLLTALFVVDAVFFTRTDAHSVTSVTLIVGFLLLVSTTYLCLKQLIRLSRLYGLPFSRHERRFALFGTGVVTLLIGLQSMGELSRRDLLVSLPLVVISYLYFSYGRAKAKG